MKLKELRKENGKTQEEVANFLHVSRPTYNGYELGTIQITTDTLIKLADFYDVSLDYLCGRNFTNNLDYITPQQSTLFKMIQKLDNDKFFMAYGYVARLLNEAVI